jgi:hypothetical protein
MSKFALSFLTAAIATLLLFATTLAQGQANVRVFHASPDAPAVDILVDGNAAFSNLAFPNATDYAALDAGSYNIQVVPTGATEPVVIEADLDLKGDTSYTVMAVNTLDSIEPLVLTDNRAQPAAGKTHVRIVHASSDAPAVDVAVKDGPVLFSNLAFKDATDFTPVDAGTYDLEIRVAGTEDVALSLDGTTLPDGAIVTVVARGLLADETLNASIVTYPVMAAPAADHAETPKTMPKTGEGTTLALWLLVALSTIGAGVTLRRATVSVRS